LYFQNTLIRVFYFVFSKYFVGVFYFCNFKILFQSILHITDHTLHAYQYCILSALVASQWVGPTNLPLRMHSKLITSFRLLHKSNI